MEPVRAQANVKTVQRLAVGGLAKEPTHLRAQLLRLA